MSTTTTANTRVTDQIVELSTGTVFYRDSKAGGDPVVFLHASYGNSMMWEHQIPAFTDAGYRFIAIDYRGVEGTPGAGDWSAQIDELLSGLGIERFHLAGTAGGGGAALQYALTYPTKLRSLVIANSVGGVQDPAYTEMGNRLRPSPQFGHLPLDFRELGPSYRAANPAGAARWLALAMATGPASKGDRAGTAGAAGAHVPDGNPRALTGAFAISPDKALTWAKLEAMTVPTLLMTGDADLYTPPSVLRMFAAHMKHAQAVVIPETGHSSYWESPDVWNQAVLAFIRKH